MVSGGERVRGMGFHGLTSSFSLLWFALIFLSLTRSIKSHDGFRKPLRSEEEMRWLFEEWQVKHDKSYQNLRERETRFEIFKDNLLFIDEHNRPENNHSYTVGLNNLADLSNEEYRSIYLNPLLNINRLYHNPMPTSGSPEKDIELQASIDWRDFGAVSGVKNQRGCACCWAFTAVATVEGINAIVTGTLTTLSEQELVDCDMLNNHCKPGYIHKAYEYMKRNFGIDTDQNYPYNAKVGVCKQNKNQEVTIDGYKWVSRNNELAIARQVARQPVASAVNASGRPFQLYNGGVFNSFCETGVDHAVTIVGYDTEAGQDYWIIKNSYGTNWGDAGYLKLLRNIADRQGKCGIAQWPLYPQKNPSPQPSLSKLAAEGKTLSG